MEDIDASKICDVIAFLQCNEQYGDVWSDEIAELYKVLDAIEGSLNSCLIKADYISAFLFVYLSKLYVGSQFSMEQ